MFDLKKFFGGVEKAPGNLGNNEKENKTNLGPLPAQEISGSVAAVKLPAESLESQLAKVLEVKQKIAELQEGRVEHYLHAKQLEEQLEMQGINETKIKEIKDQIMSEGAEITAIINSLRSEYGLEPKPVEIYQARLDMIQKEIERVTQNMAPEYRKVKGSIVSYFGDGELNESKLSDNTTLNNFRTYILAESSLPEVKSFYDDVKNLRLYEDLDRKLFLAKFKEFVKVVDKAIDSNTIYKTEGERNEAQLRLQKLIEISDDIYRELKDAKNKEGRFANKEEEYF